MPKIFGLNSRECELHLIRIVATVLNRLEQKEFELCQFKDVLLSYIGHKYDNIKKKVEKMWNGKNIAELCIHLAHNITTKEECDEIRALIRDFFQRQVPEPEQVNSLAKNFGKMSCVISAPKPDDDVVLEKSRPLNDATKSDAKRSRSEINHGPPTAPPFVGFLPGNPPTPRAQNDTATIPPTDSTPPYDIAPQHCQSSLNSTSPVSKRRTTCAPKLPPFVGYLPLQPENRLTVRAQNFQNATIPPTDSMPPFDIAQQNRQRSLNSTSPVSQKNPHFPNMVQLNLFTKCPKSGFSQTGPTPKLPSQRAPRKKPCHVIYKQAPPPNATRLPIQIQEESDSSDDEFDGDEICVKSSVSIPGLCIMDIDNGKFRYQHFSAININFAQHLCVPSIPRVVETDNSDFVWSGHQHTIEKMVTDFGQTLCKVFCGTTNFQFVPILPQIKKLPEQKQSYSNASIKLRIAEECEYEKQLRHRNNLVAYAQPFGEEIESVNANIKTLGNIFTKDGQPLPLKNLERVLVIMISRALFAFAKRNVIDSIDIYVNNDLRQWYFYYLQTAISALARWQTVEFAEQLDNKLKDALMGIVESIKIIHKNY